MVNIFCVCDICILTSTVVTTILDEELYSSVGVYAGLLENDLGY